MPLYIFHTLMVIYQPLPLYAKAYSLYSVLLQSRRLLNTKPWSQGL